MKRYYKVLFFAFSMLLIANTSIFGQVSSIDGPWDLSATWGGATPPSAGSFVTINTNVTVPSGYTANFAIMFISSGASLTIQNGGTLSVGTFIGCNGILIADEGSTISGTTTANTSISGLGSGYVHNFSTTEGVIPLATWGPNSTVSVTGYTSARTLSASSNWGQSFGNFVWNCAAQAGDISAAGLITNIPGSFTVSNTNGTTFQLATNETPTVTIGGNLVVSGNSRFGVSTSAVGTTVNVGGSFNFSSSMVSPSGFRLTTTGTSTLNIASNLLVNGTGTFNLSSLADGTGIVNISGNMDVVSGEVTETGSGASTGFINFIGANASHTFSNTGIITENIAYSVPTTNTLIVTGESPLSGNNSTSSLTVASGATLRVQSTDGNGAIQSGGGSTGNVRVANRIFDNNATVVYSGSGAQFIGNGNPTNVITTIDNASGVALNHTTQPTVTLRRLEIVNGDLTVVNDNFTVTEQTNLLGGDILLSTTASDRTATLTGDVNLSGGGISVTSGAGDAILTFAGDITGTEFLSFTGTNSWLIINGANNLSRDIPFAGPTSLDGFTINRTASTLAFTQAVTTNDLTINAGNLDANATLVIDDDLNINLGSTLLFEEQSVTINSQFNNTASGGLLSSNENSTLNILGGDVLGTIEFAPSGNTLGNFTLNRPDAGTLVTLNSPLTISNTYTLTNGNFSNVLGLSISSGATFTRTLQGFLQTNSASGGPYHLVYEGGTGTVPATGLELQAGGVVQSLISNNTGSIVLDQILTSNTDITINSGTFAFGSNTVTTENLVLTGTLTNTASNLQINNDLTINVGGVFNAPNITGSCLLSGDLTNDGTFTAGTGTMTFAGNTTILGSVNPSFNNILTTGTLNAPAQLNVGGNFGNDGTFAAGSGTVNFNATGAGNRDIFSNNATVTNFNNINITTTTAIVRVETNQNLTGILSLAANSTFDADGSSDAIFTVISSDDDPTSDGAIDIIPGGAQVTGNVTVQRFMAIEGSNNTRIYRYISSPVQNAAVADFQMEIPVTGSFTGTSICSGCSTNQSMFLYNETVEGTSDLGYEDFPIAVNTESFASGRGYASFVRGNILSGDALWDLRGTINSGDIPLPVTYTVSTPTALPLVDGFNLVGNPYPSTIDWDAAAWTKTNMDNAIYIRDDASGNVASYVDGVEANGGSRYIATGQGFWVKANATSPALTATENVKAPGQQTTFFREEGIRDLIRITMKQGTVKDETVVRLKAEATNTFDAQYDAYKLKNSTFNFFSIAGDTELSINALTPDCATSIPLGVEAEEGTYSLAFSEFESFQPNMKIYLHDQYQNTVINIREASEYEFTVDGNPESFGLERFALSLSNGPLLTIQASAADVCSGNTSLVLESSEVDVTYQFFIDGEPFGNTVAGTGNAIEVEILENLLEEGTNEITIKASNECGTFDFLQPLTLTKASILEVESVSMQNQVCLTGTAILIATGAEENAVYRWYESESDAVPVFESESNTFQTEIINKSKDFYVSISNTLGCEGAKKRVSAEVTLYDEVNITKNGNELVSSYATGNQWYNGSELIPGATEPSFYPEESGIYRVEVSVLGCVAATEYEFIITDFENGPSAGWSYYPNPVQGDLVVKTRGATNTAPRVVITNMVGIEVGQVLINDQGEGRFDMSMLSSGLYLLKISDSGKNINFKIIKR